MIDQNNLGNAFKNKDNFKKKKNFELGQPECGEEMYSLAVRTKFIKKSKSCCFQIFVFLGFI